MTTTPFDTQASTYDCVAESALGAELRRRVHAVLNDRIEPADRVVDLGCGSGLDAAWIAPQVRSVQAFDSSADMVARTRDRCRDFANVSVDHAGVSELEIDRPVNVVLANFGVINCVGDLAAFAPRLRAMLVPGGEAVLVSMARWCPIELAIGAATLNRGLVTRRTNGAATGDYSGMELHYASALNLAKRFDGQLELVHAESLGLVLPPFEQRNWVQRRPKLLGALARADQVLGDFGAQLHLGDHHIAVFRRNP